ncbi:MAG: transglycosylase SLT domain-containing protein [Betaproteobacteria bacterium]|nr:transglycosylase SLT domain-containing protein [Betaproteobacteria bacterium]
MNHSIRSGLLIFCALLACAGMARAAQDDDFLAAREAFRVGDVVKFERSAKSLSGYPLEPYIAYWRLRLRLEQATPEEVQALLERTKDGPVAVSLRADWLRLLATRQQWEQFDAEYTQAPGDDVELLCYTLQSRWRAGKDEALSYARRLWFSGRDQPDSCTPMFDALAERSQLGPDDVWARIRLALEAGNTGVARRAAEYLPAKEQPEARALSGIAVNPQAFLEHKNFNLKTRAGRETVMYAAHRLARTAPSQAAQQWAKLGERFTDAERAYVWGLIAYQGAQRHDPNALAWYAKATELNDQQLAWKVRIALRAKSWSDVLAAVDAMSPKEAQEPAWRYWKARAAKAQGRAAEAQALFTALATDFSFYGQLAAEELGGRGKTPAASYKPTRDEVQAMAKVPGFQRALAFYRLNLRFEGNREWNWTIRNFDDKQLLAAAEFARRSEIYDRAINTADRTRELHDFSMRYLAPYRDVMKGYVSQQQLDEAWVYGLIRQESRFIADVKSSAGAAGLMQLMPATARWVAQKVGLKDFRGGAQTVNVETNLNLGTWYLKHVLDTLDNHPVLASAAYNAGPGRARAWRAAEPMDAAIYAESIPFNETRDYVKKVMSNANYYSQQFGQTLLSLKERIGIIAPRSRTVEKSLDEPGG